KYLFFNPNPEQHNPNQQWLNMPFFEFLLSRLQVGGEIILATNIQSYMDNAEHQAAKLWCLPNNRYRVPVDSQRTHFEVKYLAR
ncbi:MAG TPA: SAM-dependent methyltransferase, partial [Psychrobacter sp.]|nr:SAM-dependent methyltransferase [Psychrobacter sp.]